MTKSTKLQTFQYKILHRCTVTNSKLYYFKIKQNNLCSFCNLYKEDITHLFCECLVVRSLWLELFEWYQLATDINISPDKDVIILNEGYTPLESSLILMTKYYIYICRCKEMAPSLVGLLKYVKKEITLECEADIRANQKWEPIIELL